MAEPVDARCARELTAVFEELGAADAGALAALEALCFSSPWSEAQFVSSFGQAAFRAFGLRTAGRLAGYAAVYCGADELELLNIAVLPELRRQGLGARLLDGVLQAARKTGMNRGLLEVRVGNAPARALYESFGFAPVGRRKRYYADTGEDALVYQLDLASREECCMRKIVAANWKMYKTRGEAAATATALRRLLDGNLPEGRDVVVFPPFLAVPAVAEALAGADRMAVGAQDVYPAAEGAFTGEVSPAMLRDGGASWVLVGHSERRHVLGEDDAFVGRKAAFALEQGLKIMVCVGETLEEREAGRLEAVLARQLDAAFAGVRAAGCGDLAVAYEPVWAIGTGKVAGPREIAEAHALVRRLLVRRFPEFGNNVAILYGGSVKPANAASIIALDNVDGLLVGGASLDAESFSAIVRA